MKVKYLIGWPDQGLSLLYRIIFSQRMSLKPFIKKDPLEFRMPLEYYSIQIKGFAFKPIGAIHRETMESMLQSDSETFAFILTRLLYFSEYK